MFWTPTAWPIVAVLGLAAGLCLGYAAMMLINRTEEPSRRIDGVILVSGCGLIAIAILAGLIG